MSPAAAPRWLRALDTIACLALLAMLGLTVADVIGRYVISRPVKGVTELVQYTMVVVVFAALPLVTARRQHIAVGLFDKTFQGAAERVRAGLVAGISAAFLLGQTWLLFQHADGMREAADVIGALRLPVYPAGYIMAALSALAAAVCLYALVRPGDSHGAAGH